MPPPDEILPVDAPPLEIYKSDRRSTVWLAETNQGRMVVKRFDNHPVRQSLQWLLRLHPALRERRVNVRLQRAGLPVIPVESCFAFSPHVAQRIWRQAPPCRWTTRPARGILGYVVTRHAGLSLQQVLQNGLTEPSRRRRILAAVGLLAADLIAQGWYFRDLKASNLVIDSSDAVWLIDVGSARRSRCRGKVLRMLAMLDLTLRQAGLGPQEQGEWLGPLLARCPRLGQPNQVAAAIGRNVVK